MKFLITENQYEKLLQASRERHANDPNRDIRRGGFEVDGQVVTYNVMVRNDGSVYVSYNYNGVRRLLYITNEVNFIRLGKNEQKNTIESKINSDIQKK
jgi:hypothetical protein